MIAQIAQVDPVRLHQHWPFLKRGVDEVIRKSKHTRWWPEDVYAAVQSRQAAAYIVAHHEQQVGMFIVHPQVVPFSGDTELFLWIMWSLPLREWNPPERQQVTLDTLQFIAALALQQGHDGVGTLTVRPGLLRRWGNLWKTEVYSCRMPKEVLQSLVRS